MSVPGSRLCRSEAWDKSGTLRHNGFRHTTPLSQAVPACPRPPWDSPDLRKRALVPDLGQKTATTLGHTPSDLRKRLVPAVPPKGVGPFLGQPTRGPGRKATTTTPDRSRDVMLTILEWAAATAVVVAAIVWLARLVNR